MVVAIGSPNGYVRDRDGIRKLRAAGDLQVVFQSSGFYRERSGPHSTIRILVNGTRIAFSTINLERDEDRVRLCNSAYNQLIQGYSDQLVANSNGRDKQLPWYTRAFFKNDLDEFCFGLEDAYNERFEARSMPGSRERHEPTFVLRPFILQGGGTILFAAPGMGKSYVLWTMAVCIDAGVETLWPLKQARVLVLNLERSEQSVADRLGNINEILGLDRERPIDTINARGRTLSDVAPAVRRYVDKHQPDLILLDSMSRAGRGSLLADDVVNGYCDILNGFGPAWLALAHSPRNDSSHVFGSVMFEAAADLTVKLSQQEKLIGPMGISLKLEKRNDVGKQPLWIGAFTFDKAGLTDLRIGREGEFHELEAEGEALSLGDSVVQHLAKLGDWQGPEAIADATGYARQNVSAFLNSDSRIAVIVDENDKRKKLFGLKSVVGLSRYVMASQSQSGRDLSPNLSPAETSGEHDRSHDRSATDPAEELPF